MTQGELTEWTERLEAARRRVVVAEEAYALLWDQWYEAFTPVYNAYMEDKYPGGIPEHH